MSTTFTVAGVARPISEDMFTDLGYPHVDFHALPDGSQQVTVDADLTADQVTRAKVRLLAVDGTAEALLWSAYQAWKANQAYLAVTAPTTAQALAQVRTLTQHLNGVLAYLLPGLTA